MRSPIPSIATLSPEQPAGGAGQPLAPGERAFFEPRFGFSFRNVRIHSDSRAARAAGALHAQAFTSGRNIVFGAGQYRTAKAAGRQLLAHELAHVIQQGAAIPLPSGQRDRHAGKTGNVPSRYAALAGRYRGNQVQRRAVPTPTIAGMRLGPLAVMPPDYVAPTDDPPGMRSLRLWQTVGPTTQLVATTELVPAGARAGSFPGFSGLYEAQSFALHQPTVTMIVRDVDPRFHVLNVTGAPRTRNPLRSVRLNPDVGSGLSIVRPVNPVMQVATTGGSWAERTARADGLRQHYVYDEGRRDPRLWQQVRRAYTELAVEAFGVQPDEIFVITRGGRARPGKININLFANASSPGGTAGPGRLTTGADPDRERPWVIINWPTFNVGREAVRSSFRHESVHVGTRERVRALMSQWRSDAAAGESFHTWLQRQRRLRHGGPARVTALDLQLARAVLIGGRADEPLTAAMTFTTTFHRAPTTGMDTSTTGAAFRQLHYMLANWRFMRRGYQGSTVTALRHEILRRLRDYYRHHLDAPHRAAFATWAAGLPNSGGVIMVTDVFLSSRWDDPDVQAAVRRMRRF